MARIAVTGATGRMGSEVLAAARERGDVEAALAVSRGGDGEVAGVRVEPAAALGDRLVERGVDVLVDFTAPEGTVEYVGAARSAGVAAVVGTTGLSDGHGAALEAASREVAVLRAPNFSRGIRALLPVVGELVSALEGYDVEVTGTHHSAKRDAPSGTTKALLRTIEDAGGPSEPVYGRRGRIERGEDEVGVHDRSAGDVHGEHEVLFAGNGEVVTVTHRLEDRRVYASGALDAAAWLARQPPGLYGFEDVPPGE